MLKMKVMIAFLVTLICIVLFISCEKYTITDNPLSEADSVKFNHDIKPIFSNCVGCHTGSRKPVLDVDPYKSLIIGQYVNVKKPANSNIYLQLTTVSSHKTKLSPSDVKKILQWITQGAKNN